MRLLAARRLFRHLVHPASVMPVPTGGRRRIASKCRRVNDRTMVRRPRIQIPARGLRRLRVYARPRPFYVINLGIDRADIVPADPVGAVVQWFKTMTTNEYIRGVRQFGWRPIPGKLWQRNYWEHIVRNDTESMRI